MTNFFWWTTLFNAVVDFTCYIISLNVGYRRPSKITTTTLVMSLQALTNHLPNIINCSKNDIILSFVSEKVLLVGRSQLNIRQCSITFQSKYMFEPIGYWSFWFSCVCEIIYIYINICSTTTWMLRAIIKTNVRNKKLWFICL